MRTLLILVAAVFPTLAISQAPGQRFQVGSARATAELGLRARPDPNSPVIFQLPRGAMLRTLDGQVRGDYARVLGEKGPQGWVLKSDLEVVSAPEATACPAMDTGKQKLGTPGSPAILDFNALLAMQAAAERKGSTAPAGTGARIGGFIASKPDGPREGRSCEGGTAGDWIVHITPNAGSKEFEGIVARIGSTKRNPRWTIEKLQLAQAKQFPVLITGTLHYDAGSVVNDDAANPLPGQLRRAFLWELRQVSSILVCTGGDCEVGSVKGWQPLDRVE